MRKILSFLIALGLAVIGLPVSACALAHSQARECATPQTKGICERMGMGHTEEPPVSVANSGKSCCSISQAPAPQARTWAGSFAVAAVPALASNTFVVAGPFEILRSRTVNQDSSPPLQPVLCTFLI
jgi:hypothetical protein